MEQFYKDILNTSEQLELEYLNEKPVLLQAIEKVLLANIYSIGTLKPGEKPHFNHNFLFMLANQTDGITMEHLGADLKARTYALQLLQDSLTMIKTFKKAQVVKKDEKNPAR